MTMDWYLYCMVASFILVETKDSDRPVSPSSVQAYLANFSIISVGKSSIRDCPGSEELGGGGVGGGVDLADFLDKNCKRGIVDFLRVFYPSYII